MNIRLFKFSLKKLIFKSKSQRFLHISKYNKKQLF